MLIVSIQGYTPHTTNEIAQHVLKAGAVGVRVDCNVSAGFKIGLEKNDSKYYITSTKEAMLRVCKWTSNIALDCRSGNPNLEYMLSLAHLLECSVIADIENIKDIEKLLNMCIIKKIRQPKYIATTFTTRDTRLIRDAKSLTQIDVIAEGGYDSKRSYDEALAAGAKYVCVGAAISDFANLTEKIIK